MITTFVLVAVAVVAILVLLRLARGQAASVRDLQDLEGRTQPVDLAAFRNLVDPEETAYLRAQLPAAEFRAVERQRMRAAAEYVRRAADNAAILLRLAEAARQQPDPSVAQAGQELINSALRLRVNAMLALCVLYARILLPGTQISAGKVVETYQRLTDGVLRLTRLQNPAYAARVSAVI